MFLPRSFHKHNSLINKLSVPGAHVLIVQSRDTCLKPPKLGCLKPFDGDMECPGVSFTMKKSWGIETNKGTWTNRYFDVSIFEFRFVTNFLMYQFLMYHFFDVPIPCFCWGLRLVKVLTAQNQILRWSVLTLSARRPFVFKCSWKTANMWKDVWKCGVGGRPMCCSAIFKIYLRQFENPKSNPTKKFDCFGTCAVGFFHPKHGTTPISPILLMEEILHW